MLLQNEIEELQAAKEELQYVLERHRANCRMQQSFNNVNVNVVVRPDTPPDIKPIVYHLIESADESVINCTNIIQTTTTTTTSLRIKEEESSSITTTDDNNDNNDNVNGITTLFTQPLSSQHLNKQQQHNLMKNNTTLNELNTTQLNVNVNVNKPNRPSSLNVNNKQSIISIAGVPITTPSAALPFNFDSLMEGGTGLTPVSGPLLPTTTTTNNKINNNNHDIDTDHDNNTSSKLVSL